VVDLQQNKLGSETHALELSATELHNKLATIDISLGTVINALNDVGAYPWKYEGTDDVAETVIHELVRHLLKVLAPIEKKMFLAATGYSQNAFD
jgi:hypothetical protein|tara:strand:+ start:124 stop:405 length:282 start_codon:yes stop_codon:yes gene_type:complete